MKLEHREASAKAPKAKKGEMPTPEELMQEVLTTKLDSLQALVDAGLTKDVGILWSRGIPMVWELNWNKEDGGIIRFHLVINQVLPNRMKVVADRHFTHKE